jgi:hypothetical protein
MPSGREASYAHQLGEVLRRRDPIALQLFLIQNARRYGDQRQVAEVEGQSHAELEELMHRMIIARADLKDLHRASRQWLFSRGQDSYGDDEDEAGRRRN